MFDPLGARGGGHDRGHRRDVHGVCPVTACPHDIDSFPVEGDLDGVGEHRGAQTLDLVLSLPLGAQRN